MTYAELLELLEYDPYICLAFNDGEYVVGAHKDGNDIRLFRSDNDGWDFGGDYGRTELVSDEPIEAGRLRNHLLRQADEDRDGWCPVTIELDGRRYEVGEMGYDDNGDILLEYWRA